MFSKIAIVCFIAIAAGAEAAWTPNHDIARRMTGSVDECEWYDWNGCCAKDFCDSSNVGNGKCDPGCYNPWCGWDQNDCPELDALDNVELLPAAARSAFDQVCHYANSKAIKFVANIFSVGGYGQIMKTICPSAARREASNDTPQLIRDFLAAVDDNNCYMRANTMPQCVKGVADLYMSRSRPYVEMGVRSNFDNRVELMDLYDGFTDAPAFTKVVGECTLNASRASRQKCMEELLL